eukprot:68619_1
MSRPNSHEMPRLPRCVIRKSQNSSKFVHGRDFLCKGDVLESINPSGGHLDAGVSFEIYNDEFNCPRDCQLGKIYKAKDIRNDEDQAHRRLWAIKAIQLQMITSNAADDPMKEIETVQYLAKCSPMKKHPSDKDHIMHEILAYQDSQALYMVMPYCQEDLLCRLMKCHHFSENQAKRYFRQVLCGVRFLHFAKVSHRDISLENVMLKDDPRGGHCTVVIDFGQALINPKRGQPRGRAGKLYCMPPEVFWQQKVFDGPAADLWCCGICLYVMLLGHYPFGSGGVATSIPLLSLVALEKGGITELMKLYKMEGRNIPNITSFAVDVMQSCLRYSPSKRPSGNVSGWPVNGADALLQHEWFSV